MTEKNGRLYHPMTKVVRQKKIGEVWCKGPYSPTNSDGDIWVCERQNGHAGLHMAWDNPKTGLLFPDGVWE